MLPDLVLLTNDVNSSHTFKRALFLSSFFKVTIIGFKRKGAKGNTSLPSYINIITIGEAKDKMYYARISLYQKILSKSKKISPSVIFARGSDMLLLALFSRRNKNKIWAELTDIYEISFKWSFSPLFKFFEKRLYESSDLVFSTSPAFFDYYQIPKVKQILWENYFDFQWDEGEQKKAIKLKLDALQGNQPFKIIQSGYFRCSETISKLTIIAKEMPQKLSFHLHGYANGGGFDDSFLFEQVKKGNGNVFFHGKYSYPTDLPYIFAKAHFTIVTEHHPMNLNGTLNLTNRIYESAAHYTPCIAIGNGAIYNYVKSNHLGLVFNNFNEFSEFLTTLDSTKYKEIIENINFRKFAIKQQEQQSRLKQIFESFSDSK